MPIVVRASRIGAMSLLLSLSVLSHPPAKADTNGQQAPLSNPEANADPFSSRGDNNGAIMQMIHRAMRGDANVDRVAESAAQRENLSEAANDFFAKRSQRLKKLTTSPLAQPLGTGIVQPVTPGTEVPAAAPVAQPVTQPVQP